MGHGEHGCPQRTWKRRQEELGPVSRDSSPCTGAFIINTVRHNPTASIIESSGIKALALKELMTAGATKEKEGSGTQCSRGWPCLRASRTPGPQVATPPGIGADAAWVVTGSGLQVTPGAIPRYRACPFHQDGREAAALLTRRGEREQIHEKERMLLLHRCVYS